MFLAQRMNPNSVAEREVVGEEETFVVSSAERFTPYSFL
jgi:hypothetical protein